MNLKKGNSEVAVDGSGNLVSVSAAGVTQDGNAGRDATGLGLDYQFRPLTVGAWLDLY